jgi:RNA polymerase sigma-70 factor (ECF subfamily)
MSMTERIDDVDKPSEDADGAAAALAALMGQYCDGEVRAFHDIYASLAPRILAYLTGLVGDRATAEDLLQQTFMKLHQCRSAYVRGANPVPWLYTIAHRTCLDELRRKKRARVRLSFDGNLPHEPTADITGSAEPSWGEASAGTHEQAVAQGLAALATLPEPQRQAVLLIKIHGHSTAQAASILGTTVGAIKVRAHRGYVALRRKLGSIPSADSTGLAARSGIALEHSP